MVSGVRVWGLGSPLLVLVPLPLCLDAGRQEERSDFDHHSDGFDHQSQEARTAGTGWRAPHPPSGYEPFPDLRGHNLLPAGCEPGLGFRVQGLGFRV